MSKRPVRYPGERSRWLVPSTSQPAVPNFVDMDEYDGVGFCSCEDFQFRKQPILERGQKNGQKLWVIGDKDIFRCKHLRAVIKEIGRLKRNGGRLMRESE